MFLSDGRLGAGGERSVFGGENNSEAVGKGKG